MKRHQNLLSPWVNNCLWAKPNQQVKQSPQERLNLPVKANLLARESQLVKASRWGKDNPWEKAGQTAKELP